MAHTKQTERKTNTGFPKATMGRKGGKGGKGGKGSGGGGGGAVGGNDGIEMLKEKFQVDVSVNNWKIDLPLQPLSIKSHMYMLSRKCGNYSVLQNYVYRNIRWQGRSF